MADTLTAKEKQKQRQKDWYCRNKERMQAYYIVYHKVNQERDRDRVRKTQEKWNGMYEQAQQLTKSTGILHEVDHIIPLRGVNVCGLHVPWNLCVITKAHNAAKSNKV